MTDTPKTIQDLDEMRVRVIKAAQGCHWSGPIPEYDPELALARAIREADEAAGLTLVLGFNPSTPPHQAVRDAVPLVLYFASRQDADEFVAVVQEAKPGMIGVPVREGK